MERGRLLCVGGFGVIFEFGGRPWCCSWMAAGSLWFAAMFDGAAQFSYQFIYVKDVDVGSEEESALLTYLQGLQR